MSGPINILGTLNMVIEANDDGEGYVKLALLRNSELIVVWARSFLANLILLVCMVSAI